MVVNEAFLVGDRRAPRTRRLQRAGTLFGLLVVALAVAYAIFLRATAIRPPAIDPAVRASAQRAVEVHGPRAYVGPSWMSREHGVWELHLEGEPYAMGWAHSRLGQRLLLEQEDYMFDEMARYVPSKIALWLIRAGVRLRYRHIPDFLPRERQEELAGLADGMIDAHGDFLPAYHRVVFYHALHDITQGLERSPLLGCSAFAAAGAATVNGHLIIGRNFDFEGPEIFDRDKAVIFFKPKGKIPFASVAWVGMSGVVTGINAEGIYISVNAARTDDKGGAGMPVQILMRQIMEQARSIDDAVRLIKTTPLMVPDFYLVADGKTGESAVVERSPRRTEVRRSRDLTVLTNHALTPAFAGDAENDRLKRYLTSGARYKRLDELVHKWRGQIDPKKALEILRDKKGAGGVELGLGNRNTLDAIIATHSVVVDATAMILWVGEGPHLLGKFRAFDLRKELLGEGEAEPAAGRAAPADLPADELLGTDEYRAYLGAMAAWKTAERLRAREPDRALDEARRAEGLEELLPEPHRLIGDLLRARGDVAGAKAEYQRFLALSPPYLKDIEAVKSALGTL